MKKIYKMKKFLSKIVFVSSLFIVLLSSCSEGESYSDLLKEEEKASNWYLANQTVINEIPADSVFISGEDAPFYRMDDDGFLYMQVVNPGTKEYKAKTNDQIYFRYMRTNIKYLYEGVPTKPFGNANDMENSSVSFRFNNFDRESSSIYGTGIQIPLRYLGIDCEVNLLIKSYYGFTQEQSQCIPFLYNVRYFKAKY